MFRLVAIVVFAFKAWMFVDAVRRKVDTYWYWLIPFVPGGAVIYFFAVKLREPGIQMMGRRMLEQLKRPPSVEDLERRFERTPSLANRITLAQRLFDAGRHQDALDHFEKVLAERPDDKDGLYGLGLCRLELGDAAEAADALTRLVDLQRSYREYAAFPDLAEALWQQGQREECLALLEDLVKTSPRLRHHVLRAHYLDKAGRSPEAQRVLRNAIDDERDQPSHIRRLNRPWMRRARQKLDELARA